MGQICRMSEEGHSRRLASYRRLPLYPYKQTSLPSVAMSQMCPTRWLSYVATWSADGSSIIKSRQIEVERLKRIEQAL